MRELSRIKASAEEIAEKLTQAGLEVEAIHRHGHEIKGVYIARVEGESPHPEQRGLRIVQIFNGKERQEVVMRSEHPLPPNASVAWAQPGARLANGTEVGVRRFGKVESRGMILSEAELGVSDEAKPFVVPPSESPPAGANAVEALDLRDEILDIAVTPNRPDAMGHLGLARELAAIFREPFAPRLNTQPFGVVALPEEIEKAEIKRKDRSWLLHPSSASATTTKLVLIQGPLSIPIQIEATERCSRYIGNVVHAVEGGPSPFWMRYRLYLLGQRAVDRVVDVTNWILFETGHPIHAFDLDRLAGPQITVRLAKEGERIVLLDGREIALGKDDLVIADAEGPVALAGIMGGKESAVSGGTKAILLEVAHFDPPSIRRTRRRHGLQTQSSERFERGVDAEALPFVQRRALALISHLGCGIPVPFGVDIEVRRSKPTVIFTSINEVRGVLGDPSIPEVEARRILESLGCEMSPAESGGWRVTVPSHRSDLARPEDLAEEIARIRGYHLIPAVLPKIPSKERNPRLQLLERIRCTLAAQGLRETIHFAFLSPDDLKRSGAPKDAVLLVNPLSTERSVLRTSMIPSLLSCVQRGERFDHPMGRLFEIGKRYLPAKTPLGAIEVLSLGIALFGPVRDWLSIKRHADFYDGKWHIEHLFRSLRLEVEWQAFDDTAPPWAHPRKGAFIQLKGRRIGALAEIHPDVAEAWELSTRPILAELELSPLMEEALKAHPPPIHPLPRYPSIVRDFAFVLHESVSFASLRTEIEEAGGKLVARVDVLDLYQGEGIPQAHKSMLVRIEFRHPDSTLTDAQVEDLGRRIVQRVAERLGGTLRA
ncbi:MAG: phenylalanine--tRNA ligase subunit beta [Sandaracinaceae bacterium]|nr:phenylalanine--tRNA ligase subunit beta [Sandaracinaceae bacterium]